MRPALALFVTSLCLCAATLGCQLDGAFDPDGRSSPPSDTLGDDTDTPGSDPSDADPVTEDLDPSGGDSDTNGLVRPVELLDNPPGEFCAGATVLQDGEGLGWVLASTTGPVSASTGESAAGSFLLISGPAWLVRRGSPSTPTCGDGRIDAPETCEGSVPAGVTCASLGFTGGSLTCSPSTCTLDTFTCELAATCGDNVRQGAEECDGDEAPAACQALGLGYVDGSATCQADCTFDRSLCRLPPAGCECDPALPVGYVCSSFGFDSAGDRATLACDADCRVDLTPCGFPEPTNLTAAPNGVCGAEGGRALCWGLNGSQGLLDSPAATIRAGSIAMGDQFTAAIGDDGMLYVNASTSLSDGGPALASGVEDADTLRSGPSILCAGTDTGAGDLAVRCYSDDQAPISYTPVPSSHMFATSDVMLCYIDAAGDKLTCNPHGVPPGQGAQEVVFDSAGAGFGVRDLVVAGDTVCLVHDDLGALLGTPAIHNTACWFFVNGFLNPVSEPFSNARVRAIGGAAAPTNLNMWCASLDQPWTSSIQGDTLSPGEVFCWDNYPGAFFERGPFRPEVAAGRPIDAASLTVSRDAVACVEEALGQVLCEAIPLAPPGTVEYGQHLAPNDRFTSAALDPTPGASTGCAVRDLGAGEGTIHCWGQPLPFTSTLVGADFTRAVVSGGSVCALRASGSVACTSGAAPTASGFFALAAGPSSDAFTSPMCGLFAGGALQCWTDSDPSAATAGGPFIDVAVGEGFYCSLIGGAGALQCLPFSGASLPANFALPTQGTPHKDVAAGPTFACAVGADGALRCWGDGAPAIPPADALGPYVSVTASAGAVCAVEDTTGPARAGARLRCWGDAQPDGMLRAVKAASAGGGGVCALRRNHTLACWGEVALGYR